MHQLFRHSGMDRRNPDCREANKLCHPWSLGSGDPCRNDGVLSLAQVIFGIVLLAYGLGGCTPFIGRGISPPSSEIQQQLYAIKNWTLDGRIAVKAGQEGWNANLFWEHDGGQDRLRIYGPFSQGAVSIILQGHMVYINEGNGIVTSSHDPDDLLQKRLGFSVPLSSLRFWVLGLPAPDNQYRAELDDKGGLKGFEQQAWVLGFESFESVGNFVMPKKMTIQGNQVRLRLVVDQWVFKK